LEGIVVVVVVIIVDLLWVGGGRVALQISLLFYFSTRGDLLGKAIHQTSNRHGKAPSGSSFFLRDVPRVASYFLKK
jgi:hypothetical protein